MSNLPARAVSALVRREEGAMTESSPKDDIDPIKIIIIGGFITAAGSATVGVGAACLGAIFCVMGIMVKVMN